jgi:hypothetical protein
LPIIPWLPRSSGRCWRLAPSCASSLQNSIACCSHSCERIQSVVV